MQNGVATSGTIATLGAGSDVITAMYLGDTYDAPVSTNETQVINKAHLYVSGLNVDIAHGDQIPALADEITGFVLSDSLSNVTITGSPLISTAATSSSGAGHYAITVSVSGMSAANYDFVPQNGVLTVHPKVDDVLVEYGSKTMSIMNLKRDLPFSDITAIEVIFSDNVTVSSASAILSSSTATGTLYNLGSFSYNPTNYSATWTRPSELGIDRYLLNLDNTLAAAVDHTISLYGTTSWNFSVLPGDFDGDGIVGTADLTDVRDQMASTLGPVRRRRSGRY